jgi:DNA-binding transcriptional LysR family regulator
VGGKAPVSRSNTMSNLVHAVRAGLGITPLPQVVADADTRLVRCTETISVRALIDFLVPYMQADMKVRLERGRRLRERDAANDGEAANLSKFSSPA